MAKPESVLLHGLDVRQGFAEAEVDPLAAARGVSADDGEREGLVPAGLNLGDRGLGDAQTLGDVGLREFRSPAQARQAVGDAGILHELGVDLLDLIAQAFALHEVFDGSIGPRGRLGGEAAA